MKLGILDQIPIPEHSGATDAIQQSIRLAQIAEQLGYHRYWLAEHHNTKLLASSAPEVTIAHMAARTERIRVGSGGIMSMHYSALKIAEVFNTLSALSPGRIDLGIGRAPGGDTPSILALAQGRPAPFDDQYDKIRAVMDLISGERSELPEYSNVRAAPVGVALPEVWLLGSTGNSARQAGELGVGYAFAQFFNGEASREIFDAYRRHFKPSAFMEKPRILVTYAATVADTEEEAEFRARPIDLFRLGIRTGNFRPIYSPEKASEIKLSAMEEMLIRHGRALHLVGTPGQVAEQIMRDKEAFGFDECMINANHGTIGHRIDTFRLLAQALS
jgi:luciferase family oxidoreductase group 1